MEPKNKWVDLASIPGTNGREDLQDGWHDYFGRFFLNKSILDVGAALCGSKTRLGYGNNQVTTQDVAPGLPVDLRTPVSKIDDKCYDVVTCFDTIEHILYDESFLKNLVRIAKENVVVVTPNWCHSKAGNKYHCREYTPKEIIALTAPYKVLFYLVGDGRGKKISLIEESQAFLSHREFSHGFVLQT